MFKTISIAVTVIGVATLSLSAQTYPDTFKVGYYSNAHSYNPCTITGEPDATVRLTNAGTQLGSKADPSGNLCAMIYVLTPDQQLAECCGCALTPDALLTLSVNDNLTSNPLTNVIPTNGDIKIISSTGAPTCNPSKPLPAAGVRAWATHIQNGDSGNTIDIQTTFETETAFSDSTLSLGELKLLENKCKAIQNNGSGFGICTCGATEPSW